MALIFEEALEDVETLDTWDSMLIMGDSGVGKSNFAASGIHLPQFKRIIHVDIEGSAKGIGRLNPGVKRINAPTFGHLELVKEELLKHPEEADLIIFDTINAGQELAEAEFKADPRNRNNQWGAYGDLKDWTLAWMRDFHALSVPVIFIAHAKDVKNDKTGAVKTMPDITGGALNKVPTIPDIIGYMGFENTPEGPKRILLVGRQDSMVTKNRFGLPDKLVEPTIESLNKAIEGAK